MKYNHNQVMVDGYLFDSEQESNYYRLLKDRMDKKEIFNLKVHPEYVLIPPFAYEGKQIKATVYTPDFSYQENPANAPDLIMTVAVEVKGYPTPDYELRVKLFKYNFPLIHLIVMQYSKATGWMERTDYLKARKKINAAKAVDRFEKKKAIYEARKNRLQVKLEHCSDMFDRAETQKQMDKAHASIERVRSQMAKLDEDWSKEQRK